MVTVSSSSNTFKLTSLRMIQTGQFWGRFSAKRRDIRLMFLHFHLLNNESSVAVRYYKGRKPKRVQAEFNGSRLFIGCQSFNSVAIKKLRSWAFEESTF